MTEPDINPFAGIACRECGNTTLQLEYRKELVAQPLGTWSLAGAQIKTSASERDWPWCVCTNCGGESKGQV